MSKDKPVTFEIKGFQTAKRIAQQLWTRLRRYIGNTSLGYVERDTQAADAEFDQHFPELSEHGFSRTKK
jgi:hypothetical protein